MAKRKIQRFKSKLAKPAKLADAPKADIGFGAKVAVATSEVGSSGTQIHSGIISEEFLLDLQGQNAAVQYDRMRRRETQVNMILDSIKNPIVAANWAVEVDDETDATQLAMKQLVEWNFFSGLQGGFKQHLREVLTMLDFGFAVFEELDASENVPDLDNKLTTFITKFGFRKQVTIYKWQVEPQTGKLLGVVQKTGSTDTSLKDEVVIPSDFLHVFTNRKEGDNFEGVSVLRPMYGAYSRKDLYLKLVAIGAEKYAIGIVKGTTPAAKVTSSEDEAFEALLNSYTNNEISYIKIPQGWDVEIQKIDFDPSKMVPLLNFENEEMARCVMATFLMLGGSSTGGSNALSQDLSSFFLGGIQSYADAVADKHNDQAIPRLCQMNFGPQPKYPKLRCTGINDEAGASLAQALSLLANAQYIKPDAKLEDFLRTLYRLPPAEPETAREKVVLSPFGATAPTGTNPNAPEEPDPTPPAPKGEKAPPEDASGKSKLSEDRAVRLAEGYKAQFNASKKAARDIMATHVKEMADDLTAKLSRNWKASSTSAQDSGAAALTAIKGVAVSSAVQSRYQAALQSHGAEIARAAIDLAKKELPVAAQKVKFADIYSKLDPLVQKAIKSQTTLVAQTQAADVEKLVLFQWTSSGSSVTDLDGILQDVNAKVDTMLDGAGGGMNLDAAAGDYTASVTQNSRNALFFDDDVLETLESFTFFNEDPVSEICQNLNGQTFAANDPNAEQYYPPLHHNCKSRLIPNEKGSGTTITGLKISGTPEEQEKLEKQITFSCGHKH